MYFWQINEAYFSCLYSLRKKCIYKNLYKKWQVKVLTINISTS